MSKTPALILLCLAVVAGMSPWLATAAALPDMAREAAISPVRQALMSSGVQAGFVIGALGTAILGLPDRFDPRRLMLIAGLMNGAATAALLWVPLGGDLAIALRILAGAGFAGIYPVGMKVAVGWGLKDRGLLVGILVGALTLGTGAPHIVVWLGGAEWRLVIVIAAALSVLSAALSLVLALGPHHARAPAFSAKSLGLMWTDRRIRAATGGYLGHMFELYVFWIWIGAAAAAGFAAQLPMPEAERLAALTAFLAIGVGALTCAPAGWLADRIGKANVAGGALAISGTFAVLTALSWGGVIWLSIALILIWGAAVIADSAQFSAMIADAAPPEVAGSLMAVQTALGFGLTIFTVQGAPLLAAEIGWPWTLGLLALGPAAGLLALRPYLGRL